MFLFSKSSQPAATPAAPVQPIFSFADWKKKFEVRDNTIDEEKIKALVAKQPEVILQQLQVAFQKSYDERKCFPPNITIPSVVLQNFPGYTGSESFVKWRIYECNEIQKFFETEKPLGDAKIHYIDFVNGAIMISFRYDP